MQVDELRKLSTQASDMLARAKTLQAESSSSKGPTKARLEREAVQWAEKAKELAEIVHRLAKAG
jgi:hypothetical protein